MTVSPTAEAEDEIQACLGLLMKLLRAAGMKQYRLTGSDGLRTSTIRVETWDGDGDFEFHSNEESDDVLGDTAAFLVMTSEAP